MKKVIMIMALALISFCTLAPHARAGEIDILVNKLIEKGVLTPGEGAVLKVETAEETKKLVASGKHEGLPQWVQNMKFKGDLRLRYQTEKKKSSSTTARNRGRYRFRLGVTAKVINTVEVGFGLATGSSDPRSTNQTFSETFQTDDIRIDYAYAKWSPDPRADIYAGKFTRSPVLWAPTDLMWDGDINPAGLSVVLNQKNVLPSVDLFLNAGGWVIDEDPVSGNTSNATNKDDPFLAYIQAGISTKLSDDIKLKGYLTQYYLTGVKGNPKFEHSKSTNTFDGTTYVYDYNVTSPAFEISIKNPFTKDFDFIPYLAFFGEYVYNPDPSNENKGYAGGIKLGHSKLSEPGQWDVKYIYRHLEKDAWIDAFPDSDAYGGATGIKGHEIMLSYAFNKNIILGFDLYRTELIDKDISKGNNKHEYLFQADLLFKF